MPACGGGRHDGAPQTLIAASLRSRFHSTRRHRYGAAVTLEAIVVLGCRLIPEGRLGAAALRRVNRGAAAWRRHRESIIVTSGGRRWYGVAEAAALRDALIHDHGVPAEAILAEWCSLSTRENAHYCAKLLKARGLRQTGIVTCDWHLPRALACFRAAGVMAVGLAASTPPAPLRQVAWRAAREWGARRLDGWATAGWARR